jgi:shikimate 5-dehydrogenase
MLLHQGARALELWAGRPAPVQVMREALEENIYA